MTAIAENSSNELCARIIAETQDAVIYADKGGVIQLWNAGAEAIFGHSSSEAVGQTLDLIIPENLRDRHWEGWDGVMASGVTKYGREPLAVPGIRADGSRISIEFSITILRDAEDKIEGVAAMLHDVTERWERDRAIQKRLAEFEAKSAS